jgi:hypothetical protein
MPPLPRTFHYNACAHGFSAIFTRPFHHNINVIAPSALPITGGHGASREENFRFEQFITIKAAYSHVSGGLQPEDNSNNSLATSVLEGLNMFDVLTADRIVSRLYSKHPQNADEGKITWIGSKFENLKIAGCPVHIELNTKLFHNPDNPDLDLDTFAKAKAALESGGEFSKICENPLRTNEPLTKQNFRGAILCSIVKKIDVDHPGVKVEGHSIKVAGFGKIYLGELLIKNAEKNLTMLRFELGSTISGGGSGGGSRSNGTHYP